MSGRVGCAMCDGDGYVPVSAPQPPWTDVMAGCGLIGPCPLCVSKDRVMYGTCFIKAGIRIDPRTVKPHNARATHAESPNDQ